MTGPQLAAIAGILISLAFSYIPGLQAWYGAKDSKTQSLFMLAMLAITAAGSYGLSCLGWWSFVQCTQAGVKELIEAFVAALVANQATYIISPQKSQLARAADSTPAKPTPVPPPAV